ncbi:hypothetical protein ACRE_070090 [Hapsidospora chrysogenum ATCC 11550]|uniref:Uncharacterized protein n=1 Tax=Hapsidospora chrysogenum (strain ATCC 11550 / CBS 779.69 / DSM 880 / IAM 14645 / JCM 23072 / IMI 49137) TaxID=857340 RepID=A0A086SYT1_HAPC1|nr:hypothetical protein ACRE_070090 [Hapsidospora chrysogenum ATCC 11550]
MIPLDQNIQPTSTATFATSKDIDCFDGMAAMDDGKGGDAGDPSAAALGLSPPSKLKPRSLSDSEGTPSKLSPSPRIVEAARRTSKDDSNLKSIPFPITPRGHLPLHLPQAQAQQPDSTPPPAAVAGIFARPAPLSPQLDHSVTYASPTNILPRRSRGLDFSRAATCLHHSTLAGQSSPDSSPIMRGRAMNIPSHRNAGYGGDGSDGGPEQTSTSLWSMMGSQEKMNLSHSLGSTQAIGSDTSSSDDDHDPMDEDMDEAYVTTPQVSKTGPTGAFGSPAMGGLMSFQQRQRNRRPFQKKGPRAPVGLGFNNSGGSSISNSPPSNSAAARRESISWQANQLHISGGLDGEDLSRATGEADGMSGDGQRNVVRRTVTRRGNLLPKTKNFARIRAALLEEGAPAETEFMREAEVVKQVRESDIPGLEPRRQPPHAAGGITDAPPGAGAASVLSSPNQESLDEVPEYDMMGDLALGLSSSFKQHAMRNSKGKHFWDTFSESSSIGGARVTPPPPNAMPRGSSSGMSEDVGMDSPSQAAGTFAPWNSAQSRSDSEKNPGGQGQTQPPPTAAEITRRINNKRRRDDDFDPVSFKRRAVSPSLSVHNSPLPQSPMQREGAPWGSRPGSNGGDTKGGSSTLSDSGSASGGGPARVANGKAGRVGFQGMVDTNDGIMRMSIE